MTSVLSIHSICSLEHHNHPPLEEEATLLSQKDLCDKDEQLINILCDANVPPSKISKIMNTVREDDKGTLLPKTIFMLITHISKYLQVGTYLVTYLQVGTYL